MREGLWPSMASDIGAALFGCWQFCLPELVPHLVHNKLVMMIMFRWKKNCSEEKIDLFANFSLSVMYVKLLHKNAVWASNNWNKQTKKTVWQYLLALSEYFLHIDHHCMSFANSRKNLHQQVKESATLMKNIV
jgi:hypothetical protein